MPLQSYEQQILDLIGEALAAQIGLDTEMLDDFAIQTVRDIVGRMPRHMLDHMGAETSLSNGSGATITSDIILGVTRNDGDANIRRAAKTDHLMEGRLDDSTDLMYASDRWPRWFSKNGKIYIKPDPTASSGAGAGLISAVAYPSVDASGDTATTGLPDGLERFVVLGMLIYVKMREMGFMRRDAQTEIEGSLATAIAAVATAGGRINTAVGLGNTEFDKVSAILDLANVEFDKISALLDLAETSSQGDVTTALTAITSAAGRINTAVLLANIEFDLMNADVDTASTSASTNDDLELANIELKVAGNRAATGATYLQEAASDVQEAQTYVAEVQGRLSQAQEERSEGASRSNSGEAFIKEAQGRIATGSAYLNEAQTSIGEAQTYASEVQQRLGIVGSYFQSSGSARAEWKELQEQYDKGLDFYMRGK